MALVDYLSDPEFQTTVNPSDRETIFVMDSGKLRKISSIENPVVDITVLYSVMSKTELDAVTDFVKDNRLNLIEIPAIDGNTYVGTFKTRSVKHKHLGGNQHSASIVIQGTLPSTPDAIDDLEFVNDPPTENRQLMRFTKPTENGLALAGFQAEHRNVENDDWTQVDVAANAVQHALAYAKGTSVKSRIRPYSLVDGNRKYGPFTDVAELLAGGKASAPGFTLQGQSGAFTLILLELQNYGYDTLRWNIRYKLSTANAWTNIENISADLVSYTKSGLANGQTYDVQTQIETEYGDGAWSATQQVTLQNTGGETDPYVIANPLNYSNVNVTALLREGHGVANATYWRFTVPEGQGGTWTITIDTTPNSKNWELTESDGSPASVGSTGDESFTKTLVAGDTYTFRVYANSAVDVNPTSLVLTVEKLNITQPSAPPSSTIARTGNFVDTTWTAPTNNGGQAIEKFEFYLTLYPAPGTSVSYYSGMVEQAANQAFSYRFNVSSRTPRNIQRINFGIRAYNGVFWSNYYVKAVFD